MVPQYCEASTYLKALAYSAGQSSMDPNRLRICMRSKKSSGYVHSSRISSISKLQFGGLLNSSAWYFTLWWNILTPVMVELATNLFQSPWCLGIHPRNPQPRFLFRFQDQEHSGDDLISLNGYHYAVGRSLPTFISFVTGASRSFPSNSKRYLW